MQPIIIALDAMGGDNAPEAVVRGALLALDKWPQVKIILVGNEELINECLLKVTGADVPPARPRTKPNVDSGRLEILHASEVITTDEHPTSAIRQKRDSSILVGLGLVKNGRAQAFASAGNTGALLTGAAVTIGRIPGIERPALATLIPGEQRPFFLIDSGANADCKPQYLVQFAKMGAAYMERVMELPNPRVGLINIGVESEKGNELSKEAHTLLKSCGLNFVGNVEARDIPANAADVLVCDGFVGNVVLKYTEGLSKTLMGIIKAELLKSPVSKLGALLAAGAFKRIKKRFDYSEVGGAPFLGLKALVVKAHGSSDARAIAGAVGQCVLFVESGALETIKASI
ncbi:MAG: phosphate acyltransferase PlsX [Clostridiales bacterium]|jgi:glycerol-3-phosphate acyltransferase PlsX|nr:phosphate acyltransferase PlsX [Clostridiales bacterium]